MDYLMIYCWKYRNPNFLVIHVDINIKSFKTRWWWKYLQKKNAMIQHRMSNIVRFVSILNKMFYIFLALNVFFVWWVFSTRKKNFKNIKLKSFIVYIQCIIELIDTHSCSPALDCSRGCINSSRYPWTPVSRLCSHPTSITSEHTL